MPAILFAALPLAQAPARPAGSLARDPQLLIATGLLVLVLLAGAVAIYLVDRWRKRQIADDSHESAESLTSFRAMFERGELSKEEYERVRAKMAARIRQEVVAGQPSVGRLSTGPAGGPPTPDDPGDGGTFAPGNDSPTAPGAGPPNS